MPKLTNSYRTHAIHFEAKFDLWRLTPNKFIIQAIPAIYLYQNYPYSQL